MDAEERFKLVAERAKEIRQITEFFDKRSVEYSKFSVEFSKLLVTNLHLINEGGLLATPTIAKFVGYEVTKAKTQALILTLPPTFFLLALLLAASCALATYINFQSHANDEALNKQEQIAAVRTHFLIPGEEPYTAYKADKAIIDAERNKTHVSIQRTYLAGLAFGSLSMLSFAAGCSVYGTATLIPVLEKLQ